MSNPEQAAVAALLLRLALGVMFLAHAWVKIKVFTPAGTAQFFKSLGLPGELAYLTIAAEVGGGILLILGIETRWVALALVPRMLVESTKPLHSGHHFVFDAGELMGFTLQGTVPSPAMFSCPARDQALLPAPG